MKHITKHYQYEQNAVKQNDLSLYINHALFSYKIENNPSHEVKETVELNLSMDLLSSLVFEHKSKNITVTGKGKYSHRNWIVVKITRMNEKQYLLEQIQHLELAKLPMGAGPFLPGKIKEGLELEFVKRKNVLSQGSIKN